MHMSVFISIFNNIKKANDVKFKVFKSVVHSFRSWSICANHFAMFYKNKNIFLTDNVLILTLSFSPSLVTRIYQICRLESYLITHVCFFVFVFKK